MAADGEKPVPAWQRGRVASWLVTVDHKRIGILYIVTSLVFFLAGGVMARLRQLRRLGLSYLTLDRETSTLRERSTTLRRQIALADGSGQIRGRRAGKDDRERPDRFDADRSGLADQRWLGVERDGLAQDAVGVGGPHAPDEPPDGRLAVDFVCVFGCPLDLEGGGVDPVDDRARAGPTAGLPGR